MIYFFSIIYEIGGIYIIYSCKTLPDEGLMNSTCYFSDDFVNHCYYIDYQYKANILGIMVKMISC
jgi:hypothetical protein